MKRDCRGLERPVTLTLTSGGARKAGDGTSRRTGAPSYPLPSSARAVAARVPKSGECGLSRARDPTDRARRQRHGRRADGAPSESRCRTRIRPSKATAPPPAGGTTPACRRRRRTPPPNRATALPRSSVRVRSRGGPRDSGQHDVALLRDRGTRRAELGDTDLDHVGGDGEGDDGGPACVLNSVGDQFAHQQRGGTVIVDVPGTEPCISPGSSLTGGSSVTGKNSGRESAHDQSSPHRSGRLPRVRGASPGEVSIPYAPDRRIRPVEDSGKSTPGERARRQGVRARPAGIEPATIGLEVAFPLSVAVQRRPRAG